MRKVLSALTANATRYPEKIVFELNGETITYSALHDKVVSFARFLEHQGDDVIGLLSANSIEWALADLAVGAAGKCLVPLPIFFSDAQLSHIMNDAGVTVCLSDQQNLNRARQLSKNIIDIQHLCTSEACKTAQPGYPDDGSNASRIIYTSGSTGHPRGVRLGDQQISFSAGTLAEAIQADHNDIYLSVLPFSLLLEELCGIHVPVLVGGKTIIDPETASAVIGGDVVAIARSMEQYKPSVCVLVPDLLGAWVGSLLFSNQKAPLSLRYVAIGGAPVPTGVTEQAQALGIPVYEGYGLSECCSVVSLSRPGDISVGTVGKPLDGLSVEIEDGEIVVSGPSIMDGYLGSTICTEGRWRTGDLGFFDDNGHLIIQGRRDNLLVTANGRNISPEWVETRLQGDMRILKAFVIGHGQSHLTAMIVPTAIGEQWFANTDMMALADLIGELCSDLPGYAKPGNILVCSPEELHQFALLTTNGRPRRDAIAEYVASQEGRLVELQSGLSPITITPENESCHAQV